MKPIERKAKINKWNLTFTNKNMSACKKKKKKEEIASFCTAKETINKTKRPSTDSEKIFENDATSKGLISKIHKQLIQLNNDRKQTTQLKNGQNEINISAKKTYRCSTLLVIREKQIKTTMK